VLRRGERVGTGLAALFDRRNNGAGIEAHPCTPNTEPSHLVPGAVNFVQRFGSSLALDVRPIREHCHALFLDGVHVSQGPTGQPEFLPSAELPPEEVARVHGDAMRRIHRALGRAGRAELVRSEDGGSDDTSQSGTLDDLSASLLPLIHGASVQNRAVLGPDAGRPIPRPRDPAVVSGTSDQRRPDCGGRRRRIAIEDDPLVARRILRHIGARHEPLELARGRPPHQPAFSFD